MLHPRPWALGYQGQMPRACFVLCKPIWCLCGKPARKRQRISENTFVLLTNASGNKSLCILPLPLTDGFSPCFWQGFFFSTCTYRPLAVAAQRALLGCPLRGITQTPWCPATLCCGASELLHEGLHKVGISSRSSFQRGFMIFEVPSNTRHSMIMILLLRKIRLKFIKFITRLCYHGKFDFLC